MEVYKFGGASVQDAEGMRNAVRIAAAHPDGPLVVVVSAMGKTTSRLSAAVRAAWSGDPAGARHGADEVREHHRAVAEDLFGPEPWPELEADLDAIDHALETPADDYGRFYDAVVHHGEVLSTRIFERHLRESGQHSRLFRSTELVRTDDTPREARVNADVTRRQILSALSLGEPERVDVVQGFIGADEDGNPTTLGLEGSDYTAGLFGAALKARAVTLWKDVPGVFNADPNREETAQRIDRLSYYEVLEMANYGAKVIHPKTLKPLENAGVPLRVRSFADPSAPGTDIGSFEPEPDYPPIIVRIDDLVLLSLSLRDLSYITPGHVDEIFGLFRHFRAKTYLMQVAFMHVALAIHVEPLDLSRLLEALSTAFAVRRNEGMELITIRHYDDATLAGVVGDREVFLEQRSRATVRVLVQGE